MKCWHWWRSKKWWVRWIAYAAFLIIGFYTVENIRGHRALEKAKAEYLAAGYRLDIDEILGPPIPDEENFAAAEVIYEEIEGLPELDLQKLFYRRKVETIPSTGFEILPFYFETPIQPSEARLKLDAELRTFRGVIKSLEQAAFRQGTRWPNYCYRSGVFPETPRLDSIHLLRLKTLISILAGESALSLRGIVTQIKSTRHMMKSSSAMANTLADVQSHFCLELIKEGLRRETFSRKDLLILAASIDDLNESISHSKPLELEVAIIQRSYFENKFRRKVYFDLQKIHENPIQLSEPLNELKIENFINQVIWCVMPQGWHDRAVALFFNAAQGKTNFENSEFDLFLTQHLVFEGARKRRRKNEKSAKLSATAVDLEIHYLDHGSYPDPKSLQLPSDHFGYQLDQNGRPVLWYSPDKPVTEPLDPGDFDEIDSSYIWHYR